MKLSLTGKLALALGGVAALTGILMAAIFQLNYIRRFNQFVLNQQTATALDVMSAYYTQNGSWNGVADALRQVNGNAAGQGVGPEGGRANNSAGGINANGMGMNRRLVGLADQNGMVLIGVDSVAEAGEQLSPAQLAEGVPVVVNGEQVGTLLVETRVQIYSAAELLFLRRTNRAIALALLSATLFAAVMGWFIARGLTRPIKNLTAVTREFSAGKAVPKVEVRGSDEVAELSQAFNQLTTRLQQSDRLRKQMTADIAHDLRTPLTVVGGYLEAIRLGDLPLSEDRLDVMSAEIGHMQNMVADLRLLSQSDSGELVLQRETLDPAVLVRQVVSVFALPAENKGVRLRAEAEEGLGLISGDFGRLMRVLENLTANALRYTPAGGEIVISNTRLDDGGKGWAELRVRDSGSGIDPQDLPFIFERFQRGDKSRHAEENQSGLGLAIVRALVEAHGGRVWAESKPGEGTLMIVRLPLV